MITQRKNKKVGHGVYYNARSKVYTSAQYTGISKIKVGDGIRWNLRTEVTDSRYEIVNINFYRTGFELSDV